MRLRRQILNRYAGVAQLSAFLPVLLFLAWRLASWAFKAVEAKKGAYNAIPESPLRKVRRQGPLGTWESRYRHLQWWLGDDVVFLGRTWGQRDEWVFGLGWGFWMLILTVTETGDGKAANTSEVNYKSTNKKQTTSISQSEPVPLQYLNCLFSTSWHSRASTRLPTYSTRHMSKSTAITACLVGSSMLYFSPTRSSTSTSLSPQEYWLRSSRRPAQSSLAWSAFGA